MEKRQYKAAFVIQIRSIADFDVEAGRFEGRVEHVASFKAAQFHSLDELLAFIAGVLITVEVTEQP
jgi:hypothetical protein